MESGTGCMKGSGYMESRGCKEESGCMETGRTVGAVDEELGGSCRVGGGNNGEGSVIKGSSTRTVSLQAPGERGMSLVGNFISSNTTCRKM
jgi:hypothetical protein